MWPRWAPGAQQGGDRVPAGLPRPVSPLLRRGAGGVPSLGQLPVPLCNETRRCPSWEGLSTRQDAAGGGFWCSPHLLGRGIGFSSLRCSISLKRDSCDCFQMCSSSPPAGWGGCGKRCDGNQNPDQMYRVSRSDAHIWPQRTGMGTAGADGQCPSALPAGASIPGPAGALPCASPGLPGSISGAVHPPSCCPGFATQSRTPSRAAGQGTARTAVSSLPGPTAAPGMPGRTRDVTGDVRKDWDW